MRSEKYRRLIASMPCVSCGLEGQTQAAHQNEGKGMGLKTSDATCVPLCHRCHADYDQGSLPRAEKRALFWEWLGKTHTTLLNEGKLKI